MGWLDRFRKQKRAQVTVRGDMSCHVCGTTRAQVERHQKQVKKQLEKQFGKDAAFIGFGGSAVAMGFLKCPKCGRVSCSKCALELPGHSEKSCPHCATDYVWESIIQ